jgi:glycosyltransferase involved in cell wall biosynthesis
MHVGVDATCWLLPRGFGRHARCLLRALTELDSPHTYTFFTDAPDAVAEFPKSVRVQLVPASLPTTAAAAAHGRRRLRDLLAMSRALGDPSIDVLLFPTIYSYVPVLSRARKVVVIHDTTAERFPRLTLDGRAARMFWRVKVALGRRQASVLATVSEYSRTLIAKQFGVDEADVHVVGEAADPIFRRLETPAPTSRLREAGVAGTRRLVVYVGGFSPHKNIDRLFDAFGRLQEDAAFNDVDLALVGEYESEAFFSCYTNIRRLVADRGLLGRVFFTGYLPDDDLVVLLNLATVLVLPSLTEGFGLPAIEAAACGCPVIATSASPLPAILQGGGLYVDPSRPLDLDRALRTVLESPALRRQMREAGLAAAARLSWTAAARQLLGLMEMR